MTLQQLEYIVALDKYRHFVKASEKCFVTQPTLTMQVRKLEEEIGINIFDRSKKPLEPTIQGEEIIILAKEIISRVTMLKNTINNEKDNIEGEFRLGIIPTLAPYLIPLFLPLFIKENPKTVLKIYEIQSEDIISSLKNDRLDLAILSTPLEEKKIIEHPVFHEPFLLYLPEFHPYQKIKEISSDKITTENILLLNEGHCFREQILNVCSRNRKHNTLNFDYESGSLEALKRMVRMNLGYTLIPELAFQPATDKKHIKRFTEPEPVREISIAVSINFTKRKLISRLKESIIKTIPERFLKINQHSKVLWR